MFKLSYNNKDITADIKSEVYSISYTDYIEGTADILEINITDPSKKWLNKYYPQHGASLEFALKNGDGFLNLGKFYVSELSYTAPPYTLSIKAQSTGLEIGNRTLKAKSFIDTDLKTIVNFFAKKLKLEVVGNIEPIKIRNSIQYGERDLEYLKRLANEHNYFFKIHQNKIIFSQNQKQQMQIEVLTLKPKDIVSINLNDYIKDSAKQVSVSVFDLKKKTKLTAKANSNTKNNTETLETSAPSGASFDAIQSQANASIYASDSQTKQGNITLIGNPILVAGQNIKLSDFYNFNGVYLIKSARHNLSEQGFITDIEVRFLK